MRGILFVPVISKALMSYQLIKVFVSAFVSDLCVVLRM